MRTLNGISLGLGLHGIQDAIYESDDLILDENGGRLYLVRKEFELGSENIPTLSAALNEGCIVDYVSHNIQYFIGVCPVLGAQNLTRTCLWSNDIETGFCANGNLGFKFTSSGIYKYNYSTNVWDAIALSSSYDPTTLLNKVINSYRNNPIPARYHHIRDSILNTGGSPLGDPKIPADATLIEEVRLVGCAGSSRDGSIIELIIPFGDAPANCQGTHTIYTSPSSSVAVTIASDGTITSSDFWIYNTTILYI